MCNEEEDWKHILRSDGTEICRDETLGTRFRNIDA
jgi:hypothetical protein